MKWIKRLIITAALGVAGLVGLWMLAAWATAEAERHTAVDDPWTR